MLRTLTWIALLLLMACADEPTNQDQAAATEQEPASIDTVATIEEILEDSLALDSAPVYDYDTTSWSELTSLEKSIFLDLRYATANNFVKSQLYECGRCLLRPEVARAVVKAHRILQREGLGLKMYDCYRPRPVQQKLWDIVPNASYVTPPAKGSMHNRGCAVDLTLVDAEGNELDMGTEFDFFGEAAHHTTLDLPEEVLANRRLLKTTMEKVGLRAIRTEWWHYSYPGCDYALSDMLWGCGE